MATPCIWIMLGLSAIIVMGYVLIEGKHHHWLYPIIYNCISYFGGHCSIDGIGLLNELSHMFIQIALTSIDINKHSFHLWCHLIQECYLILSICQWGLPEILIIYLCFITNPFCSDCNSLPLAVNSLSIFSNYSWVSSLFFWFSMPDTT